MNNGSSVSQRERDLEGGGAVVTSPPVCVIISQLDDALEWCEDQILIAEGLGPDSVRPLVKDDGDGLSSPLLSLRRILEDYLELDIESEKSSTLTPHSHKVNNNNNQQHVQTLAIGRKEARTLLDPEVLQKYFKREDYQAGQTIFEVGDRADKVFFIESGFVEIVVAQNPGPVTTTCTTTVALDRHHHTNSTIKVLPRERVNKISSGGIFGEAAFFLDLPQR